MKKSGLISIFGILLASLGFISAAPFNISNVLESWNQNGIFAYLLPFLIIFSLVYAILTKSQILGTNQGAIIILSLALGLLSLVGNFVPEFFAKIAPNLGVGLSILLAGVILMGLFSGDGKLAWLPYVFFGLGALIFIFVVINSFSGNIGNGIPNFWDEYGSAIVTLVIIVGLIIAVIKWK